MFGKEGCLDHLGPTQNTERRRAEKERKWGKRRQTGSRGEHGPLGSEAVGGVRRVGVATHPTHRVSSTENERSKLQQIEKCACQGGRLGMGVGDEGTREPGDRKKTGGGIGTGTSQTQL